MKINNKIAIAITALTVVSIITIASNIAAMEENTAMGENTAMEKNITHVSDSVFIPLEYQRIRPDNFILLYDSTPYPIKGGHVAVYINCDDEGVAPLQLAVGVAPDVTLIPLDMQNMIHELSEHGEVCLYHVDIPTDEVPDVTDIALVNTGNKIVRLAPEAHAVVHVHGLGKEVVHGNH